MDLHERQDVLIDMAMPCITWGGQLEAVSAYDAEGSPSTIFARLCAQARGDNPMGWSLHRTTIEDAVAEGFAEKLAEVTGKPVTRESFLADCRRRCRTEQAWLSQYLCQPQDDGGALLSYARLAACESPLTLATKPGPKAELYLGMDIGRKHDLSVIWIVERVGDVLWTRDVKVLEKTPFHVQLGVLSLLLRTLPIRRACIDATGIGANLAEDAQRLYGSYRVEAVQFSAALKSELAMLMLRHTEDRTLRLPPDPAIREDLHKVRRVVSAAGTVRYLADSTDAGHADRFCACALALFAASSPGGETYVEVMGDSGAGAWRSQHPLAQPISTGGWGL